MCVRAIACHRGVAVGTARRRARAIQPGCAGFVRPDGSAAQYSPPPRPPRLQAHHPPTHLGLQHERRPRFPVEGDAQSRFAQAHSVERARVKEHDSTRARRGDGVEGVRVVQLLVQVAEGCASLPEHGHLQAGRAQRPRQGVNASGPFGQVPPRRRQRLQTAICGGKKEGKGPPAVLQYGCGEMRERLWGQERTENERMSRGWVDRQNAPGFRRPISRPKKIPRDSDTAPPTIAARCSARRSIPSLSRKEWTQKLEI